MIAKIPKPGKSFGGVIEYNLLKKDANILYADGVRTDQVKRTIVDFNMQRKLNPGLGQAVGHIALSWSAQDRGKLNDGLMTQIAKEYLQKMKIDNTQVLIVRHHDKNHPHLHIVYNRINNDGKTIPDNFQRQKSIKVAKALTLQHGFYIAPDKKQVNREQLKGADQVKYELYDKIKAASKKATAMSELKQLLAKQGIGMLFKYKSGTLEIQGVSFSKGDVKFKGSEIDRSLSYGNLSKQLNEQREQKLSSEQEPSLAQQLRTAMAANPTGHHAHHPNLLSILLEHPPEIVPEPEDPNLRKKKRKGQGISR